MNNIPLLKLVPILLVATLVGATSAAMPATTAASAPAPTPPSDILAHGSADMYWIARVAPPAPGSSSSSVETFIQARHIGGDPNFQLLAHFEAARVVCLTSRGNQLAALLDSGDWRWIWEGDSSGGVLPSDGSRLVQLAASPERIWAIGLTGQSAAPSTAPTSAPASQPAATQPAATTMPAGTLVLYRLDAGQWNLISPLPPAAQQSLNRSLVIVAGKPVLAALLAGGHVRSFTWNDEAQNWESLGSLETLSEATHVKVLGSLDRLALWTSDPHGPGELFFRDQHWGKAVPLTAGSFDTDDKDVTVAGQGIRLLAMNDGKLMEYSFGTDGTPQGSKELPIVAGPAEERPFDLVSALAAAMLMLVLVQSVRRRSTVPPEAIEAAGLKLAPLGLRLLAGTIDALPIIGTVVVIMLRLGDQRNIDVVTAALLLPLQIAIGVYVVLTLVSELLWGWTIGKKLCGLRVVMLDGSAPKAKAIVLRNVLRIVDAALIFPLLLVLVSPLRQRVGDAAAETIVVLAQPETPPPPSE